MPQTQLAGALRRAQVLAHLAWAGPAATSFLAASTFFSAASTSFLAASTFFSAASTSFLTASTFFLVVGLCGLLQSSHCYRLLLQRRLLLQQCQSQLFFPRGFPAKLDRGMQLGRSQLRSCTAYPTAPL